MKIKKGDKVMLITGDGNRELTGEVLVVKPADNKIIVKEMKVVSKHKKPRNQMDQGGIIKQEAAFDASNAMVICPKCGKATRIGYTVVDGKKVRQCKKCEAVID